MRTTGQHLTGIPAALPTGRQVIVALIVVAIIIIALWIPVFYDNFMDGFGVQARKFAPKVFAAGLVILLGGLLVKVGIIDIIGGSMMGAVVVAAIVDNY